MCICDAMKACYIRRSEFTNEDHLNYRMYMLTITHIVLEHMKAKMVNKKILFSD